MSRPTERRLPTFILDRRVFLNRNIRQPRRKHLNAILRLRIASRTSEDARCPWMYFSIRVIREVRVREGEQNGLVRVSNV